MTGAPAGTRKQYATDKAMSGRALAQGYAYAATDRATAGRTSTGTASARRHLSPSGTHVPPSSPGPPAGMAAQRYGRAPRRTYIAGISGGGCSCCCLVGAAGTLLAGGVDGRGGRGLAGRHRPAGDGGSDVRRGTGRGNCTRQASRGSEFWPYHEKAYWGLTQKIYRAESIRPPAPACAGPTAGSTLEEILAPCRRRHVQLR
ncbi:hypothetical protein LV779_39745 [Streptomyces thinghirensis]|nr:hypothetical protein [Streptomyces thinghirensis]